MSNKSSFYEQETSKIIIVEIKQDTNYFDIGENIFWRERCYVNGV